MVMDKVSMAASYEMESPSAMESSSVEVFLHTLHEHFGSLPDPRVDRTKAHLLYELGGNPL